MKICDSDRFQVNSEHPIAKAVVEHARMLRQKHGSKNDQITEVKDFKVHPGAGVSGRIGERAILVGNRRLMQMFNVPVGGEVDAYVSENEHLARTCVLVAVEGAIAGAFAVTDPVKPEAAVVISYLRSMNISSVMVTGDNWATATAIGSQVGINKVFAETDPLGKADKIKELQVITSFKLLVYFAHYIREFNSKMVAERTNWYSFKVQVWQWWETGSTTHQHWWQPMLVWQLGRGLTWP